MYRLSSASGVIRITDGAVIPADEANTDWKAYTAWLQAGNIPQPAPVVAPTVPVLVSPFQARAALDEAGQLDTIEAYIAQPTTPRLVQLAWTQATEFRRGSLMLMNIAIVLGMTQAQLDALFTRAAQIEV